MYGRFSQMERLLLKLQGPALQDAKVKSTDLKQLEMCACRKPWKVLRTVRYRPSSIIERFETSRCGAMSGFGTRHTFRSLQRNILHYYLVLSA
jgi:hypothetical protein